jgi:hypothetical protein
MKFDGCSCRDVWLVLEMASAVFTPLNISLPQKKSQKETLIREQKSKIKKKVTSSSLQICLSSSSLPSPVYRVQRNSPTRSPQCDSLLRCRSCYTIYFLRCAEFSKTSPSNSARHHVTKDCLVIVVVFRSGDHLLQGGWQRAGAAWRSLEHAIMYWIIAKESSIAMGRAAQAWFFRSRHRRRYGGLRSGDRGGRKSRSVTAGRLPCIAVELCPAGTTTCALRLETHFQQYFVECCDVCEQSACQIATVIRTIGVRNLHWSILYTHFSEELEDYSMPRSDWCGPCTHPYT